MKKLNNSELKKILLIPLIIFINSLLFAQVYENNLYNNFNQLETTSNELPETNDKNEFGDDLIAEPKYKTKIIDTNDATFISRTNSYHALFSSLGTTILTDYFTAGLKLSVDYNYGFKNTPIYTGIGLNGTFNFPQSNYPYTYKIDGNKTTSPSLLGFSVYVPCGIFIKLGDTDLYLNASARIGMKCYTLMLFSLQGIYAGSITPAFYFNANAGILYKFIGLSFEMEFDNICQFYPAVSIYAQIKRTK